MISLSAGFALNATGEVEVFVIRQLCCFDEWEQWFEVAAMACFAFLFADGKPPEIQALQSYDEISNPPFGRPFVFQLYFNKVRSTIISPSSRTISSLIAPPSPIASVPLSPLPFALLLLLALFSDPIALPL